MFLAKSYALEFYVHSGRENNNDFAILNISDESPFLCKEYYNRDSFVSQVVCSFSAPLLSRFEHSETLFFSITTESRDELGFNLKITPKDNKKIKLFNTEFSLTSGKEIPLERNNESRKWQILGFVDGIPFINDKPSNGINFPLNFDLKPQIGVLDAQMRPMGNEVGRDKDHFLSVQSFMSRGSYEEALNAIDEMLAIYPNTIFKRDVLFLRLEALDGLNAIENYEDIISLGKAWIEAYPTDIHISQALYIMAKNYANMKFFDEAKYYYERLFNEHKGDKYELLARLNYGENLYSRGDRRIVLEMYNSVLNETNDLEVASLASVLLADYYRKAENKKDAQKYLNDVLVANPNFFLQDIPKYFKLMQEWAEVGIYEIPAKVAEVMFKSLEDRAQPMYMPILRDMAVWFDKAKDIQKAHFYYDLLIRLEDSEAERNKFKDLDNKLLLNADENDATKRLEHYDYILENYKGQEEEKIALEKKAQTLYDLKDFNAVFAMRQEISEKLGENNEILLNAVSELVREGLKGQDCKAAAYYGSLYEIPLGELESFALFNCLYENKQYAPALNIAKKQVEIAKDTKDKEKWLYHLAWVEFMQNNYPKAALAARDALMLLSDEKYSDSAWVLFMALHKQGNNKEAFKILPTLEEKLKDDNKMIEVYYATLQDALERRDDTAIKVYAKKLMDLQELHKRYEYSPFVELGLAQTLSRESDFNAALQLLMQAESRANTQEEKIQIYYLQGYLYTKLNDTTKAVESYEKCESIEAQSSWKNLCIDAKNLLKKD